MFGCEIRLRYTVIHPSISTRAIHMSMYHISFVMNMFASQCSSRFRILNFICHGSIFLIFAHLPVFSQAFSILIQTRHSIHLSIHLSVRSSFFSARAIEGKPEQKPVFLFFSHRTNDLTKKLEKKVRAV